MLGLFFLFLSFFSIVFSQIIIIRIFPILGVVRTFFISFLLNLSALILINLVYFDNASYVVLNSFIFVLFSFCYFGVVNGGDTSLRIRVLREIVENKIDDMPTLLNIIDDKKTLFIRLERLTQNGQLVYTNNEYSLGKSRLLYLAILFDYLRKIFGYKSIN